MFFESNVLIYNVDIFSKWLHTPILLTIFSITISYKGTAFNFDLQGMGRL